MKRAMSHGALGLHLNFRETPSARIEMESHKDISSPAGWQGGWKVLAQGTDEL